MFVSSRVFSRVSRSSLNQYCRGISSSSRNQLPQMIFTSDSLLVSRRQSTNKWVPCQVNYAMHNNMFTRTASQQFWYSSSSASPQPNEKENSHQETNSTSKKLAKAETSKVDDDDDAKAAAEDTEMTDLSVEDLVKLVAEKEDLLVVKQKEIKKMQDKVLGTYAELKVFAIQSFVTGLLDVADNLGRASSVVKDSFAKIEDSSKDTYDDQSSFSKSNSLFFCRDTRGSEYQNMEKSLEEIKELLKVLTESLKNKSEEEDKYITVEICKGIVDDEGKDLFRYYVEEYCHVLKSFEKKEWREIFVSLSKEQRRVWMRSVKDNWIHTPKTYLI